MLAKAGDYSYCGESGARKFCALTFQHVRHLLLEIIELEWCEEPQGTKVKSHYRRYRLLEEQACVEESSIAAQADDKVDAILESKLSSIFMIVLTRKMAEPFLKIIT